MKPFLFAAIAAFSLLLTRSASAQNSKDTIKPLIIQTLHVHLTPDNRQVNLDSLLKIWKEKIMDPNPYFVSTRVVKHWWGHDSREILFIYELKSWDDISKAFEKRQELIKTHKGWASEAEAHAFGKLWVSIFVDAGEHSDEIYQVVAE